jgi:hypothetical protein
VIHSATYSERLAVVDEEWLRKVGTAFAIAYYRYEKRRLLGLYKAAALQKVENRLMAIEFHEWIDAGVPVSELQLREIGNPRLMTREGFQRLQKEIQRWELVQLRIEIGGDYD